ncbi:cytochrome b6-f complex subunit PetL [Leptolyngbya sp. PCC 6406]|nr:cytochrome b6-f complex subunit PetL [Leptolyngbya sp. PCC 6406]
MGGAVAYILFLGSTVGLALALYFGLRAAKLI